MTANRAAVQRRWKDQRRAMGWRMLPVWLPPDLAARLETLRYQDEGLSTLIVKALRSWAGSVP